MAKHFNKKHDDHHVRIYDKMQSTGAWKALSGSAVKVLLYVASFETPKNPNGSLFCSALHAAHGTGLSKPTTIRAFQELQDKGFLRATAKGHFQVKGGPATCWRLTWLAWPGVKGATKEYEDWTPPENKTRVKKLNGTGKEALPLCDRLANAGKYPLPKLSANPQKRVGDIGQESLPQTVAIGDAVLLNGQHPSIHPEIAAGQIEIAA